MGDEVKEKGLKKVHSVGKVCNILVKIAIAVTIFSLIFILGLTIYLSTRENNAVIFDHGTVSTVTIDTEAFGHTITDKEREEILNPKDNDHMTVKVAGIEVDYDEVQVDGNVMTFTESTVYRAAGVNKVIPVLISLLISIVISLVSLIFGGRLAKAFRDCETPFEENVIKQMRAFAFSLFPWVFGKELFNTALDALLHTGGKIDITFDFSSLIAVLVIFAFVEVFRYGAVLQQESDETL